jgi:hypothetical protein
MFLQLVACEWCVVRSGNAASRRMKVSGQHQVSTALTPVPTEQEAGWAPEPVWAFWRGKKSRLCREYARSNE